MPLKIRCPHCHRVLIAADETVGQQKLCPACGQVFNVPQREGLPVLKGPSVPGIAIPRCPRCQSEVGPTATICRRCHTDLATGQRLPWRRRLGLFSWRFWTAGGLGIAAGGLLVIAAVQFFLIRGRSADVTFTPTTPRAIAAGELAEALLRARDAAQRRATLEALRGVEEQAAPAIAAALARALDHGANGWERRRSEIVAIDLLARHGAAHPEAVGGWCESLGRCQQVPELREAALRARALLGDAAVADELTGVWLARLERHLLLRRAARVARTDEHPAVGLMLRRASVEVARAGDGLSALAAEPAAPVFERLVAAYWESWAWLGQDAGDRLAEEIFELGRPPGARLEFKPEDVRRPRDALRDVADRAEPATRAAAGLILLQRGPQYRSLCHSIADTLAAMLPEVSAPDQQRLTWAVAQLRGRLFGPTPRTHPLDVTAAEVAAALRWARPDDPARLKEPYPAPPALSYRAVTPARLLEQDLLAEIERGWETATIALDRWLMSGLGCTPRVVALVHPGQRRPGYPALATAMVVIATANEQTLRPQLELWRGAEDQPAWVRALAYTVLGSLDARRGRWDSGWPEGLDLGDLALLDAGQPGWEYFGRVLAAGGPDMRARLADSRSDALPARARDRLSEAADRAARGSRR